MLWSLRTASEGEMPPREANPARTTSPWSTPFYRAAHPPEPRLAPAGSKTRETEPKTNPVPDSQAPANPAPAPDQTKAMEPKGSGPSTHELQTPPGRIPHGRREAAPYFKGATCWMARYIEATTEKTRVWLTERAA